MPRFLPPAFRSHWLNPLLFSWPIDREALDPLLPDGLEIDHLQGQAYMSLVGLRLESIRVFGIPAPVSSYDEINLRFYVRRKDGGSDRCPGVVFVRQMVPHRLVALAARSMYGEPFFATRVSHEFGSSTHDGAPGPQRVAYLWEHGGRSRQFWAENESGGRTWAEPGSLDEFLTKRHWGYNGKPGTRTKAYQLTRSEWPLLEPSRWDIDGDAGEAYGEPFAGVMRDAPASVILAVGSRAEAGPPTTLAI